MTSSSLTCTRADILYVHPAKQEVDARYDEYVASPTYPLIPVGVVGLANMLIGEGWALRGLNLPLELLMRPRFNLREWLAAQGQPRLVMVDLHWYEHSFGALDVARASKSVYPNVPVVLGGLTASRFARSILQRFPEVDYVIRGDAERPLKLLAEIRCGSGAWALASVPNLTYRDGHEIRENARTYVATSADLDELDLVSLDFLEHGGNYQGIQYTGAGLIRFDEVRLKGHWLCNGRGCVFDCSYCGGARTAQRKLAGRDGVVLRSTQRVLDDIARLKEMGVQQVSFTLDPAVLGPEYWKPLLSGLRDRGLTIGIYNEFFQLPSDEFLDGLAAAADLEHTEVAISPLSGDERVRRLNGKAFTNADLFRVVDALRGRQVRLFVYFSLNLPGETPKTFRETLRLAEQIGRRYPAGLLRMINKCHTLDPASPMSEAPGKFGIRTEYRTFADYYRYCEQTGWQARLAARGTLRGFGAVSSKTTEIESMARQWDAFAEAQPFRCFAVPKGW